MARQLSIEISHAVSRRSEKVFLSTPEGSSNGAFSLNVWIRSPNTIAKDMTCVMARMADIKDNSSYELIRETPLQVGDCLEIRLRPTDDAPSER
jgi:hypothetical protein